MEIPCVRFDDLSAGGSGSFGLLDPAGSMIARRLDDVPAVMGQAESAARDGLWVAGYVAYEAAPAFNHLLTVRPAGLHDPMRELPLARFDAYRKRVELDEADSKHFPVGDYHVSAWSADATRENYRDDLAKIGRSIMAGEVTQLKHTFRLHAAFSGDAASLYRDLLLSQRGSYAVYMDLGRFRIVSASPEGFFRRVGDIITLRPVLASIRRGRWLEEDQRLADVLRAAGASSYTNRLVVKGIEAELSEIGELAARPDGDEFMVRRFETLWHLTTGVAARLRPHTTLLDTFSALFPPVTVTGIPKVEAMELVTGTEDTARGVYCGVIGYLAPASDVTVDASFNVAVRTVAVDQEEGVAEFGVGSAVTNRSDVVSSYEEARLKAKVLVDRRPEFLLWEDFRCVDGTVEYLREKVGYLEASGAYFGYSCDVTAVSGALRAAARTLTDGGVLALQLGRDGEIDIATRPLPLWHGGPDATNEIAGVVATEPVSSANIYLFHRTTNCRVAAAMTMHYPDTEAVVFCNELDEVAGAVGGNVAALIGQQWVTPPIASGTKPTAIRNRLLEAQVIAAGVVSRSDLTTAPRVAVLDDVHGWRDLRL